MAKYGSSFRTQRNGFTGSNGGVYNRAGTEYILTVTDEDTRMIRWESNISGATYDVVIDKTMLRFIQDGSLVAVPTPAAYSGSTGYVSGDIVSKSGVNYVCISDSTPMGTSPPNTTYWWPLVGLTFSIPSPFTTAAMVSGFQFVQDGERMTFTHPDLGVPIELVRYIREGQANEIFGFSSWPLIDTTAFGAQVTSEAGASAAILALPQPPTGLSTDKATGTGATYVVTSLNAEGEESLPCAQITTDIGDPSSENVTLGWDNMLAARYNIYVDISGIFFFNGSSTTNSYVDNKSINDIDQTGPSPPSKRDELVSTASFGPAVIGRYQQRTLLARFNNNTQLIDGSKIGFPRNYTIETPAVDDASIQIKLKGKHANGVRHLLDLGDLFILTDTGEWLGKGDASGALTPSTSRAEQYSYFGANSVPPETIGSEAVYVQSLGSSIRSIGYDILNGGRDGYLNKRLDVYADHLLEQNTVVDWAYQQLPHSILWAVRDDGTLIAMTYVKEQQVLAFHRHDTLGSFLRVVAVPEGSEQAIYFLVKRTVNGSSVMFIERMYGRLFKDRIDAKFLDCSLSYDGRNTGDTTMTLSGSGWTSDDTLTLTASADFFSNTDLGNEIQITGPDGTVVRLKIADYSSATVVTGTTDLDVPVSMQAVAIKTWAKAVNTFSGLDHLEGQSVAVFADGQTRANPNNSLYGDPLVVNSGSISLSDCFAVVNIGLPYISDLETLDIDTPNGETIADKKKITPRVTLFTKDTRGLYVGDRPPPNDSADPLENLQLITPLKDEDWQITNGVVDEKILVTLVSSWNRNGRIFIRQIDPEPMTILAIAPAGLFPFSGG